VTPRKTKHSELVRERLILNNPRVSIAKVIEVITKATFVGD